MTEGGQISCAAVGNNLKSLVSTCMLDQLTGDNLSYQNESQNTHEDSLSCSILIAEEMS